MIAKYLGQKSQNVASGKLYRCKRLNNGSVTLVGDDGYRTRFNRERFNKNFKVMPWYYNLMFWL